MLLSIGTTRAAVPVIFSSSTTRYRRFFFSRASPKTNIIPRPRSTTGFFPYTDPPPRSVRGACTRHYAPITVPRRPGRPRRPTKTIIAYYNITSVRLLPPRTDTPSRRVIISRVRARARTNDVYAFSGGVRLTIARCDCVPPCPSVSGARARGSTVDFNTRRLTE